MKTRNPGANSPDTGMPQHQPWSIDSAYVYGYGFPSCGTSAVIAVSQ